MGNVTPEDIYSAVQIGRLNGYTGNFRTLGGGEVNDTFVLDCDTQQVVVRFPRYQDIETLRHEAKALKLMHFPGVPKLVFFDDSCRINNKLWIIESYVPGNSVSKLSINQYRNLGRLLAHVHKIPAPENSKVDLWRHFLYVSNHFGNEQKLLNHSDITLNNLIHRARGYFGQQEALFGQATKTLTHGDATPSNVLADGYDVSLIDWEFSKFEDPMLDFSTIYYDDMEFNKGLWRPHITSAGKTALFEGYKAGGGAIDEERIQVWMNLDKLGAAVYLYWKMYESGHEIKEDQLTQYRLDLQNLLNSLQHNLPQEIKVPTE